MLDIISTIGFVLFFGLLIVADYPLDGVWEITPFSVSLQMLGYKPHEGFASAKAIWVIFYLV